MNRPDQTHEQWNERCSGDRASVMPGDDAFRLFYERSVDPMWILDHDTSCVLDCNQAAVELLGAGSKAALLGRHPVEVSPVWQADGIRSEDRAAVLVALAQAQGGARFEWELKRLDGTVVPVEVVSTGIAMGGRDVFFVVSRDIRQRRQAEAALQEQEQLLASVADNIREAIYRSAPDHRLTFVNRAYRQMFGYSSLEELQATPRERLYADPARRPGLLERLGRDGFFENEEIEYLRKDGSRFWGLANAVVVRDVRTGKALYHVGSITDITERKQAADAVRALNATLEQRVAERTAALQASEGRFRTLVEHAPEAIVVLDGHTGRFLEGNENALRLYGLTRAELLAVGPAEVSPERQPDGRPSADAAREWTNRANAGETPVFEWTHRRRDGVLVPCEVRLVRLPDEGGRALVRGSVTDNTQRRRRERIQQATFEISEAVHTTDDLGSLYRRVHEIIRTLLRANNFYLALLDRARGVYDFPYFVDERDTPPLPTNMNSGLTGYVMRTGKPLLVNRASPIERLEPGLARFQDDGREVVYLEKGSPSAVWLGVPLRVRGEILGVMAVQDYDNDQAYGAEEQQILGFVAEQTALAIERKRGEQAQREAEAGLLKALAREKELGELRSNFVSLVSHEFRTPLGIILSSAEILRDYLDQLAPDERRQHLDSIQKSTRRMAGLMEEVLLLGRFEAGRMDFQPQALDLAALCRRLVEEVSTATDHVCPVRVEFADDARQAVADERLLRHIFTNLLANAVKYSPPGSQVEFVVRRQRDEALCQVRDLGLGIPAEDREWLFRAFQRGRNVGDRPGTGLGLVIVKRCLELHGGQISVESAVGRGSTFTVRLPLFPSA